MAGQTSGNVPVTYFTCTLGEAQQLNNNRIHFKTVSHLIDVKADSGPDEFAVAFPKPRDGGSWSSDIFTYRQLQLGSVISQEEQKHLKRLANNTVTVALLCPSSLDFLFTWLRLMRAGYTVLLIAPQCHPEAIDHLCKVSNASLLLHHDMYSDLAHATSKLPDTAINAVSIPWQGVDYSQIPDNRTLDVTASDNDTAFIFHTSGTSGGLPKAIPQSQHGVVGVLPSLDGRKAASFTTTPLYHGGIADCLRTWSSSGLIWLFPGADVPITNKNILNCIKASQKATQEVNAPSVKYFSSVPYILEMLASEKESLKMLQGLDMVGVGGAALSPKVGDRMVQEGVHLLSRFGSAECGFLLSSYRDYKSDREWQFLRPPPSSPQLKFELQSDGSNLSELIILKDWPHMSKRNREDGSFATSDLFEPHPTIKGAWRYHSRSDSQITLVTGKKFDPAPVEDAIRSALEIVKDILVVGNGKPEPGAIVIPSQTNKSQQDVKEAIWSVVNEINGKGQAHTRISKGMISIVSVNEKALDKSSKGTVLRRKAEDRFAKEIENLYGGGDDVDSKFAETEEEIKAAVKEIVYTVVGDKDIQDDDDFYQYGVDSNQCTKIRNMLQRKIKFEDDLPFNVVYDSGNMSRLAKFLIDKKIGVNDASNDEADLQMMQNLVAKFSNFTPKTRGKAVSKTQPVIVLTGATGSLGAHILHILRTTSPSTQVVCLVRASNKEEARKRVSKSLTSRRKPALRSEDRRITCSPSKLEQPDLGLSKDQLGTIRNNCVGIIHAAWPVNFSLSLTSFSPQLQSLQNLVNICLTSVTSPPLLFCSSTASVLGPTYPSLIPETISTTPQDSDTLGYSRSKWVAENICYNAAKTGCRAKVLRIGQLTGDTVNGVWNMSEAWPLMLSTVKELGCLPVLDEDLTWLPVDVAAKAVVDIVGRDRGLEDVECPVFHITNNERETSWRDMLSWLRKELDFKEVGLEEWLKKLETLDGHPAKNLAWLWRKGIKPAEDKQTVEKLTFGTEKAKKASEAMRRVRAVDEALVRKIWRWLKAEIATEDKLRAKL